ncbi:MAG TPA: hypothetical protein VJM32_05045 [Candidatus Saccharimonadales bacterium]|nr:hypothetical protein [Candidatus Saccharimonadales bacterium]
MNLRELTHNKLFVSFCFGALVAIEALALDRIISLTVQFDMIAESLASPVIATLISFVLIDSIRQMKVSRRKRAIFAATLVASSFALAVAYTLLKLYWVKLQLSSNV